jgi:hypothetical protein
MWKVGNANLKRPDKTGQFSLSGEDFAGEIDDQFSVFKAQLLVKADSFFQPEKTSFEQYLVKFTIPRVETSPVDIDNAGDYDRLLRSAYKQKEPVVSIQIFEKMVSRLFDTEK